jgi:hypothetical protein
MAIKDPLTIEVLMGIGTREGQWLTQPEDRDLEMWHPSRSQALADAAQYAADHGGPVVIHADQP